MGYRSIRRCQLPSWIPAFAGMTMILSGCSSVSHGQKQTYELAYRTAVKEEVRQIAAQFQGGNFPYYHWAAPIVQDVEVPGHIANGVFIPAHKELVIIKPGEWAQSAAYPIESQKETYEHKAPSIDIAFSDITHLPNGKSIPGGAQPTGESQNPE
jgi:hypothetical protein